ncbi:DUF4349 domain-containing protein [Microbulbifer sp. EKSA008]|uniref:DUF4349 domain-containing protein n=1 Tax=Microbulbifer sp. EKSA008 TaxID=3243367 RepID=UPI0040424808
MENPYGRIHFRIHLTRVDKIIKLASKQGGVIQQETKAEDLHDVIIDNQKRLEMLLQYQSRLVELKQKSASDIDTLIKVAEKLASVQSDIEYSQGKKLNCSSKLRWMRFKLSYTQNPTLLSGPPYQTPNLILVKTCLTGYLKQSLQSHTFYPGHLSPYFYLYDSYNLA